MLEILENWHIWLNGNVLEQCLVFANSYIKLINSKSKYLDKITIKLCMLYIPKI